MSKIKNISAFRILDSRGDWTVQARIETDDGVLGIGNVPAGASIGRHEAALVDPMSALENINSIFTKSLAGQDVANQEQIDKLMIEVDGTERKSRLGANAILAVSTAVCNAAAKSQNLPLYKYIAQISGINNALSQLPVPLFNLINGGVHASNHLDFQEFMTTGKKDISYKVNLEAGVKIYHKLKDILRGRALSTDIGDEGGFAPKNIHNIDACELLIEAIEKSGFKPDEEIMLAFDIAASQFFDGFTYDLRGEGLHRKPNEFLGYLIELDSQFPVILIEDPFAQDAWDDWQQVTARLGKKIKIVGDDITATNPKRVKTAIEEKAINAVIIKPNQIGTLTEAFSVAKLAKENNITIVASHRSGETEDTFIAEFAVGIAADYIKTGAPARGERTAKYNRLLEIERELGL